MAGRQAGRSWGGMFLYKCRLCGGIQETTFSPDWHASVTWAFGGVDLNRAVTQHPMAPTAVDTHQCADGRVGVTDLVGVVPKNANTQEADLAWNGRGDAEEGQEAKP